MKMDKVTQEFTTLTRLFAFHRALISLKSYVSNDSPPYYRLIVRETGLFKP